MTTISLVCATRGRTAEVEHLLASLVAQCQTSMEVIIVDQNLDDRLVPIIDRVKDKLDINHIRMVPSGVSAARNAGFRAAPRHPGKLSGRRLLVSADARSRGRGLVRKPRRLPRSRRGPAWMNQGSAAAIAGSRKSATSRFRTRSAPQCAPHFSSTALRRCATSSSMRV